MADLEMELKSVNATLENSKKLFNNTSSTTVHKSDKSLTDNIIKDLEELKVEFSSLHWWKCVLRSKQLPLHKLQQISH